MDNDGSNVIQLTNLGKVVKVGWTPSGKAWYLDDSGAWTVNADGTNIAEIMCGSEHIISYNLSWTSDSQKLIYSPESGANLNSANVINLNNGYCRNLSFLQNIGDPQWRP